MMPDDTFLSFAFTVSQHNLPGFRWLRDHIPEVSTGNAWGTEVDLSLRNVTRESCPALRQCYVWYARPRELPGAVHPDWTISNDNS